MKKTDQDALFKYFERNADFEHQMAPLVNGVAGGFDDWTEEDIAACARSFWANQALIDFVNEGFESIDFEVGLNPLFDAINTFDLDVLYEKIHNGFREKAAALGCLHVPDDAPSHLDLWLSNSELREFFRFYLKVDGLAYKTEYWLSGDDDYCVLPVTPGWSDSLMRLFKKEGFLNCDDD